MKLKIRFPGRLWPIRKQNTTNYQTIPPPRERTEWRYIIGLLILWGIVMLFSVSRCNAQIKPLKVGDTVPDMTFTNVLNYKSKSLKLSGFKNKVVVLDFWATWCTSCLARFPEEKALQRRMSDTMQIILVNPKNTRNTHAGVIKFFEERKHEYDFPSIDEDTILYKLVPGNTVPRFAWILNNVVVAMPEPEELTANNVRAAYLRQPTQLASGHKESLDFSKGFLGANKGSKNIRYYSFIAPYQQSLLSSFNMNTDSSGRVVRIDAVNMSIRDLVELCPIADNLPANRIIKDINNTDPFSTDSTSLKWRERNRFTYEASFSARSPGAALDLMRSDIEQYFQIRIDTISRDTNCYIVTLGDSSKINHGKKGIHGETNIFDHLNHPIFFHNTGMNSVISGLEQHFGLLFIDDSGFKGRINIELPPDFKNFAEVAKAFDRQGFHITRTKRRLTFTLVRDQPSRANHNFHK